MNRKRTYNIRLIHSRRSYSTSELADLFGIHVRTIQSWRKQGLEPINPDESRYLFMGNTVKEFIREKQASRKSALKEDEFYCPRCRQPRKSLPEHIEINITDKQIGKSNFHVQIKGVCEKCQCKLNRFATKNGLKGSIWSRFKRKVKED